MNILELRPLRWSYYLILFVDGFYMRSVDDVLLRVMVLLIPGEKCNMEFPAGNLFPYFLNPWSPISSPCGSRYREHGCVNWRERLLGLQR